MLWDRILSLMGNFDLDPDRVLDLVIESYTKSRYPLLVIAILKKFKSHSIVTLLGNRIAKDSTPDNSQKVIYAGPV